MLNYNEFENKIKIKFKNKKLLLQSLIHKSYDPIFNNEKLEFLGDRGLGLVLSKRICELYPNESEGDLDKRFASLVNRKTCLKMSKSIGLNKFLILGNAYKHKSKIEDKILSDVCEAFIGAIYLDAGYKVVESVILKYWNEEIKKTVTTVIDSKTKLQEYSLKLFKKLPNYNVLSFKGPPHRPLYKVSVKIKNSKLFYGEGNSKKEAQLSAAEKLLKALKV